jgi:hypothetical protein
VDVGRQRVGRIHLLGVGQLKASHEEYARALAAVSEARAQLPDGHRPEEGVPDPPEVAALAGAYARLRAAEDAVRPELDAAWERNRLAIQHAKRAVVVARGVLAQIEVAAGTAARLRNPIHPVLNAAELADIGQAAEAVEEARQALTEAQQTFKAGVTPEQLGAAG